MDFAVLPPPFCPPRRAGGARTPPARALRASHNPACASRSAAAVAPSPPAAARTPPARPLRVSVNPACVSRPSAATATAAKKPKPTELSGAEAPTKKRPSAAGDGKENKNAPTAVAGVSKSGIVQRLPLGNTTTRLRGAVAGGSHVGVDAAPVSVANLKATPADPEIAVLRPCSRGAEAPRSPFGNTAHLGVAADDGHVGADAAPAPVAKRKATTVDSDINVLRPCGGSDGASTSSLGHTERLRVVGAAADVHAPPPPTPAAKRKAAPSEPGQAKRHAPVAAASSASASPSPLSSDSGGTVRELLETARTATEAIRRRDMERLRAQARRKLDRVVRTVEFNDPFISPQDVLW